MSIRFSYVQWCFTITKYKTTTNTTCDTASIFMLRSKYPSIEFPAIFYSMQINWKDFEIKKRFHFFFTSKIFKTRLQTQVWWTIQSVQIVWVVFEIPASLNNNTKKLECIKCNNDSTDDFQMLKWQSRSGEWWFSTVNSYFPVLQMVSFEWQIDSRPGTKWLFARQFLYTQPKNC